MSSRRKQDDSKAEQKKKLEERRDYLESRGKPQPFTISFDGKTRKERRDEAISAAVGIEYTNEEAAIWPHGLHESDCEDDTCDTSDTDWPTFPCGRCFWETQGETIDGAAKHKRYGFTGMRKHRKEYHSYKAGYRRYLRGLKKRGYYRCPIGSCKKKK